MKKSVLTLILLLYTSGILQAQQNAQRLFTRPKLVVGIVVDQMRYDYLTRFWEHYTDKGFKRMIQNGYTCKNHHYNYIPTYTGPGHASIYTGTTPEHHGIIANYWYDKQTKKNVYCVADTTYTTLGSSSKDGQMAPSKLITTTIADQLKLATQQKAKVIGIALKDRGAILPVGHTADAAYWFEGKTTGAWISSSYYQEKLPKWVARFNESNAAKKYVKTWNTLKDITTYTQSNPDFSLFEGTFKGKDRPVFPYALKKIAKKNKKYSILKATPFGNSLTTDFAITAIDAENLGQDTITDFLAISYSSTDYVGHRFGVYSKEVQDTYLRLDQDIARLLQALDTKVGAGNYTVFLTADHAAVPAPSYLESVKIPAGYVAVETLEKQIKAFLQDTFATSALLENFSNGQVFLNRKAIAKSSLSYSTVSKALAFYLQEEIPQIKKTYTKENLLQNLYTQGLGALVQKGFHPKKSGDVIVVFNPATIIYPKTGSTHGSGFAYDTHTPLLFFGKGVKKGSTTDKTDVTQIAPTMASFLGIAFPNAANTTVIPHVLE